MATEEPAPKRAKPDEEAGADAPAPLYEKEPEKYVSARDAIKLAFVGADGAGDARFVPEYVHQIFEGESIACPPAERPLNIEVLYAASTLDVYYRLAGDPPPELEGAAEAAMYKLAEALPPPAGSLAQLTEAAGAAFDPAELCGEPLPSTDPACAMYIGGLHEGPPSRRAFAERIQSIFRWAIETSEAIDMDDERWRLLTLFAVAPSGERTFVGAATLFRFQRWASAKPGEAAGPRLLVRICQVAVAPSARSQGHGARMLRAVYEYARAEGAQEVTVEDPNPSFRLLRDLTDVRACLAAGLMKPESASAPPTAAQLAAGRTALLITEEQLVRLPIMAPSYYGTFLPKAARCRKWQPADGNSRPRLAPLSPPRNLSSPRTPATRGRCDAMSFSSTSSSSPPSRRSPPPTPPRRPRLRRH